MKRFFFIVLFLFAALLTKAQYTLPIRHVHTSYHFISGFGAGTMVSLLGNTPRERLMLSGFSGAALGIAKEGYDLYMGGKPSVSDIIATTAGSIVGGLVVNWAFKKANKKYREKPCKM